jgi:hypothetical protein
VGPVPKKIAAALGTALLVLGLGTGPAEAATVAAPRPGAFAASCSTRWGTPDRTDDSPSTATVANVRSGRHRCFDRLVIDLKGRGAGYSVHYTDAVRAEGSGFPMPLRGSAFLEVSVDAAAYDDEGQATYRPDNPREVVNVSSFRAFRQVVWAGSFEGQTRLGIGLRARLPFRVLSLASPGGGSRLVIDVARRR